MLFPKRQFLPFSRNTKGKCWQVAMHGAKRELCFAYLMDCSSSRSLSELTGPHSRGEKEKMHLKCFNDILLNISQLLGISQTPSSRNKSVRAYHYAVTHEMCMCREWGALAFPLGSAVLSAGSIKILRFLFTQRLSFPFAYSERAFHSRLPFATSSPL